jgi:hypothetical protein
MILLGSLVKSRGLVTTRIRLKGSTPRRWELRFVLSQLANTPDSGLDYFRANYAKDGLYQRDRYPDDKLLELRDELRLLWDFDAEPGKPPDLSKARSYREGAHGNSLQHMVDAAEGDSPVQTAICNYWLRRERLPYMVNWTKAKKEIVPVRDCLPVVLATSCVRFTGNLKICQNANCDKPYFISKRRDQKYCSPKCAAPAKRESKRMWWAENRSKLNKSKEGH